MSRLICAALVSLLLVVPVVTFAQTHVDGYTRKDGTYAAPHWRSSPDSSSNNNWSTQPNINPYTGQQGTREPKLFDLNPGYQKPSGLGTHGGYNFGSPSRRGQR
jgi:opacity protein-like surface antigen